MKKTITCLAATALCLSLQIPFAGANGAAQGATAKSSCVLMEFTNNTRFKGLQPEKILSDLVMEKMIASGKFNLKETRPLAQETADLLYDENVRLTDGMNAAMEEDDFTPLFERLGFDSQEQAASISVAYQGQIVTPSITAQIGEAHNAEYLAQGTIFSIGHSSDLNEATQYTKAGIGALGMILGGRAGRVLEDVAGSIENKETSVIISGDVRLIKVDTGKVVWSKSIISRYKQDKVSAVGVTTGSDTLHMDLVAKALDQMAQKIVEVLIADMNNGKLFVK